MPKKQLKDIHQRVVVLCLARFMPPQEVAQLVKEQFEIEITRQAVEAYDPTKVAGADLRQELREQFKKAREEYLADITAIPIANKICRLIDLDRLKSKAEAQNNFRWASHLIKQAKEEVEGVITGKTDPAAKNAPKAIPKLSVTIQNGTAGDSSSTRASSEAGDGASE
jgi:hypothetical protein